MLWNDHWRLEGQHAFLGASKHHWINYDEAKLRHTFDNWQKAKEGTELHELAKELIKKRIKLRGNATLAAYVNDAIGFRMDPEVPLVYNEDFFGTPDAIKYEHRTKRLRIHDLKTGVHPGHMNQLKIYAALFFLEYGKLMRVKPHDVEIILRIYQNDEIIEEIADPDEILRIMNKGEADAKLIAQMKELVV
jgi:hypothetical protein